VRQHIHKETPAQSAQVLLRRERKHAGTCARFSLAASFAIAPARLPSRNVYLP
jgi:hypothetical protein